MAASKTTIPPYVTTTDDNLRLPQDYPVTDEANLGLRLTGAKLKIPEGPLKQYVADWLSHSGAIPMILDDLVLEESEAMRESLARGDITMYNIIQIFPLPGAPIYAMEATMEAERESPPRQHTRK